MKKSLLLILACVVMLCACQKSMNQIINNEPSITGTVVEVYKNSVLMEDENSDSYSVSLNAENSDSYTDIVKGDEIVVYFDGSIAESYPMQINKVYAITLKTPADREINNNP